jgi:PAS domain S-box-containing protein
LASDWGAHSEALPARKWPVLTFLRRVVRQIHRVPKSFSSNSNHPMKFWSSMGTILIVDDEIGFRRSVAAALHRSGHQILEASNSSEALDLAVENQPELIISDVCMEEGDGLALLKSIRADPRTATIPFVVMTGQPDFQGMVVGAEQAADAYLPKPFSFQTLLTTVEHRLGREKLLRRSAEEIKGQLQRILEVSPDLIGIIEPKTKHFIFLNVAGRKMLGFAESSDVSRHNLSAFLLASGIERLEKEAYPSAMRDGMWAGENILLSSFGRQIPVKQFLQAHRDQHGTISYLSTIAHDLSDDKEAQAALKASETKFRSLVDSLPDAVIIHDLLGRIVFANARTSDLFGYDLDELKEKEIWNLFSGPSKPEMQGSAAHGREHVREAICVRKSGEEFPAEVTENQLELNGERVQLSIIHDISSRRKLERERQIMEVQLRQALKLESIGQLAAGIAHEINTPTQYIGDNTRFLQDSFGSFSKLLPEYEKLAQGAKNSSITPELIQSVEKAVAEADLEYLLSEIPKAIQQSLEGVERVTKLVRAMKDFSHPGVSEKTAIDLNHTIDSTITVARNEWKYVANMVLDFDAALPPVPCHAAELNQVILNLIVNAAHAIADVVGDGNGGKGTITVSTAKKESCVEIRIQDTGTGIPEHARQKIFEPFFTTKEVGKGTGQGLAISRSVIVDKHGGRIYFETEVGQGTTFIIQLPLTIPSHSEK